MPKISSQTKQQIKGLSAKELQQIVLKMMSRDQMAYDYVWVNFLNKETGEEQLFEQAKADLDVLFYKGYKGFSEELKMANMLAACIKRVNEFTKVSGNKALEADLLLYVLEVPFSSTSSFGTCFTNYDYKVAQMLKRLITIVTKKLNEDHRIDYEEKINGYLNELHDTSDHIDTVYDMQQSI